MTSIKSRVVSGLVWESIGRFSELLIQFFITILIARVLSPADYGTIGLLYVFIALGQILIDSGFSQALIQKRDADEIDFSSVFFFNIIFSIILYLFLFLISPYIASHYKLYDLKIYARVLFLIIPINAFGLIQNVIIQKELAFKKTANANIISATISGIVGIGMAYSGFGIWALVCQQISLNFTKTLIYILLRRWVPVFTISLIRIKEMFAFSMNLMLHSFVNTTMKNIYIFVIGKHFPVEQVGNYTQADKFQEISGSTLSQIILKVSLPALVQKKDDLKILRESYIKILTTSIFIVSPIMVFLNVVAESLFRMLLTERWLSAVPYFRILSIYGIVLPILQISYNLYKLFGKAQMLLFIDSFRHFLVIISILFTIKKGIYYMLIGLVASTIIMVVFNLYKSGTLLLLTLSDQLRSILPYYFTSIIAGAFVYYLPDFNSDFLNIIFSAILFIFIYLFISKLLRFDGYFELISIHKNLMKIFFNKIF